MKKFLRYVIIGLVILFAIFIFFEYIIVNNIGKKFQNISSNFVKISLELLNRTIQEVSYSFERKIDETVLNIKNNPENFEEYLTYLFARAPYYFKDVYFEELDINKIPRTLRKNLGKDQITYYSVKNISSGYFENRLYIRVKEKVYLLFMKLPTTILKDFFKELRDLNIQYSFINSIELYSENGAELNGKINRFIADHFNEIVSRNEEYKIARDRENYEVFYPVVIKDDHSIFGPMILKISFNFSFVFRVFYFFVFLAVIFVMISLLIIYKLSVRISKDITEDLNVLINNMKQFKEKKELYKQKLLSFKIDEINEIVKQYSLMAEELIAYMQELNATNQELESSYLEIEKINKELEQAYIDFSSQLAMIAEGYDENTGNHIERVGILSAFVAEKLGFSSDFVNNIRYYAPLHDIGKIFVPRDILLKEGKLTEEEWEEMKKHTIYGARLIGDKEQFETARNIALYHHENYDGTGYPYGLEKAEIPIEAMITHIVDVYDALRSERPYKKSFTHEETMKIILEGDGRTQPSHFAPEVLEVFKRYEKEIEKIWNEIYLN
ncbi:HD-GYP domain-containing protein (c-di-GMP phosphodiesterase class II) [Thermosipho japonicus]|uniref:HD-GYP domain-containing protein (C-di-GMP phosphodiesterase class II) n=1 Tax=Thermosipho japonicus TaxID=90323 RepID=A0A841GEX9_9BACT|nr:HD-GYP domain-containing protein [Thermosipho japonicus]MBB6062186.1 HD-GYP domain-containing protein (c-di-GMP phosphodiesterase class II) [Thermosipho japonicus]